MIRSNTAACKKAFLAYIVDALMDYNDENPDLLDAVKTVYNDISAAAGRGDYFNASFLAYVDSSTNCFSTDFGLNVDKMRDIIAESMQETEEEKSRFDAERVRAQFYHMAYYSLSTLFKTAGYEVAGAPLYWEEVA